MPRDHGTDWQIYDSNGRRKYLSAGERERFLGQIDSLAADRRALCLVLAYTGCRVSEALAITRHHIDADRCAITFRTLKRRKIVFRAVPIPRPLCDLLLALATNHDGRIWPIHRATVWRCIREITEQLRIAGPMACPRGLRHGFGIHAVSNNVPPNLIQRWMGHASPTTTAIYLDAVGAEERNFANRMWPAPLRRHD